MAFKKIFTIYIDLFPTDCHYFHMLKNCNRLEVDGFLLEKNCCCISELPQISANWIILVLKINFIAKISLNFLQFSEASALIFQSIYIMLSNFSIFNKYNDISIVFIMKSSIVGYLWDNRNKNDNQSKDKNLKYRVGAPHNSVSQVSGEKFPSTESLVAHTCPNYFRSSLKC